MIAVIAQFAIAVWLGLLIGVALGLAAWPRRPFVVALDRAGQRRMLLWIAGGGAVEAVLLMLAGLWS